MSQEFYRLTATEAVAQIQKGTISCEALVRSCLDRIAEREPSVAAWEYLDARHALAQARELDRGSTRGPLHGVPVGVKDIVDTVDMPTTYGSPIYKGHRPQRDAASVAITRAAGGVIMGKTVTTEYAFRYPGKTGNPHNIQHTPGGSSSGSAAAVADFMVPLALATQTGGSVIRPAAYCGCYGYKPTLGTFSFAGIGHLSERFDTLGVMARSLEDVVLYRSVLLHLEHKADTSAPDKPPTIAFCRTPRWEEADKATKSALEQAAKDLSRAGAKVSDLTLPAEYGMPLFDAMWLVTLFELTRVLAPEWHGHWDGLSSAMREQGIKLGRDLTLDRYIAAMKFIDRLRSEIEGHLEGYDIVLTAPAVGEADVGRNFTGSIAFSYLWMALDMPSVTIPAFKGPAGLPIGAHCVARRYDDEKLLHHLRWVVRHLV